MEVSGYKAFSKDKKNEYGKPFEEGGVYTCSDNDLIFGHGGHGFHFCKNVEDCLIYFPREERVIAKVTGLDEVREKDDDLIDSFGICIARTIRIDKFLTRDEIVAEILYSKKYVPAYRVVKFIKLIDLTPEEIEFLKLKYCDDLKVLQDIWYYQEGDEKAYSRPFKETEKKLQLIKERKKELINNKQPQ